MANPDECSSAYPATSPGCGDSGVRFQFNRVSFDSLKAASHHQGVAHLRFMQ
ncbi:hypothetical protein SynBIOSU31_02098 [Synechococcus sp. BIOS-U3-1]|nr:hypothetical protein SynBIOSU31_02098 [Synechococcus sp. BIOS-U3-1]